MSTKMPPRGLAEKKKDKKKKVNFKEVEKKKSYSTKIPVSSNFERVFFSLPGLRRSIPVHGETLNA